MATNDQIAGGTPADGAADPNVRIPDHVKAAAAAADKIHEQYYPKNPDQAAAPAKEALPQPAAPEPLHTPDPRQQANQPDPERPTSANEPANQVAAQPEPQLEQNVSAEEWRHRYLSMQGRFHAAQKTIGSMEHQMTELGQELVRTQNLLSSAHQQPQQPQKASNHEKLITDADREAYGDELIDLARRAALSSVAPEIEQLRAENQDLNRRVQSTTKRELFAVLDGSIPNWRAINQSPQFVNWLRLPNVYTSQIRKQMLDRAVSGANAPQVIALFRDFLAEVNATGQQVPTVQDQQQVPQPAPRQPALALETLAAPGRARPASGDSQVPADKPTYSRDTIKQMYRDKQRGVYAGREAEFQAFENDLSVAQREGRIR